MIPDEEDMDTAMEDVSDEQPMKPVEQEQENKNQTDKTQEQEVSLTPDNTHEPEMNKEDEVNVSTSDNDYIKYNRYRQV
jgi:hypothetical protein